MARNCRDAGEVGRAGRAVDERDAVEEHRRRERAEQEVLEAGLLRREAPAVERGEHVQRDRQDLERQEDRDEVVGRRHQHHAGGRAEHQREVLGPLEVLALQVADDSSNASSVATRTTVCTNTAKPSTATSPPGHLPGERRLVRPLPCTNPHCTPVNTAAVATPADRDRAATPRARAGRGARASGRSTMSDRGAEQRDLRRDREPVDRRRARCASTVGADHLPRSGSHGVRRGRGRRAGRSRRRARVGRGPCSCCCARRG